VQAAGSSAASARFAALFVQTEDIVAKAFSATGPVANAAIDAVVQQTMQGYPATRHASLGIVQGTKLVYAKLAYCAAHNTLSFGERVEDNHGPCGVPVDRTQSP
jgi:hypothetical protein